MITKFKLFENPDSIYDPAASDNPIAEWCDMDSYIFGYPKVPMHLHNNLLDMDRLWLESDCTHENAGLVTDIEYFDGTSLRKRDYTTREDFKFAGRVWLKTKLLSFWYYPEKGEMKPFLKDLKYEFKERYGVNLNFYDGEWRVEIVEGEIYRSSRDSWSNFINKTKIIPLTEYDGSEERTPEELKQQHILSPMLVNKPKSWKSKKLPGQLKNELEVAARSRMFQENFKAY